MTYLNIAGFLVKSSSLRFYSKSDEKQYSYFLYMVDKVDFSHLKRIKEYSFGCTISKIDSFFKLGTKLHLICLEFWRIYYIPILSKKKALDGV